MAHFDTEYQRLEASYSDSPPGEENLLMHVPEGVKCMIHMHKSQTNIRLFQNTHAPFVLYSQWCLRITMSLIGNNSFAAQWHHIENLDLFFQRISFEIILAHFLLTTFWIALHFLTTDGFRLFLNTYYVYNLHQKNGFTCMLLGEIFELVYVFSSSQVVFFSKYSINLYL